MASINIHGCQDKFYPAKLVKIFQNNGWTWNQSGYIGFWSGDLDTGEPTDVPIEKEKEVWNYIKEKTKCKELCIIEMVWEDTDHGGSFMFYPDGTVSLVLNGCRKNILWDRVTDVNWYLERLLPPLRENGIHWTHFEYSHWE